MSMVLHPAQQINAESRRHDQTVNRGNLITYCDERYCERSDDSQVFNLLFDSCHPDDENALTQPTFIVES